MVALFSVPSSAVASSVSISMGASFRFRGDTAGEAGCAVALGVTFCASLKLLVMQGESAGAGAGADGGDGDSSARTDAMLPREKAAMRSGRERSIGAAL